MNKYKIYDDICTTGIQKMMGIAHRTGELSIRRFRPKNKEDRLILTFAKLASGIVDVEVRIHCGILRFKWMKKKYPKMMENVERGGGGNVSVSAISEFLLSNYSEIREIGSELADIYDEYYAEE